MVTGRLQTEVWCPRRPEVLRVARENMRQNQSVFFNPVSIDMRVLATEPPVRVERGLGKICAAAVNVATKPQSVLDSLGNAMSVRTSNVETDFPRANGLHGIGGMP